MEHNAKTFAELSSAVKNKIWTKIMDENRISILYVQFGEIQ